MPLMPWARGTVPRKKPTAQNRCRGKAKMRALVAVMRKLLHAIFGMFKHQQPFDGAKVYTLGPVNLPTPIPQEVA